MPRQIAATVAKSHTHADGSNTSFDKGRANQIMINTSKNTISGTTCLYDSAGSKMAEFQEFSINLSDLSAGDQTKIKDAVDVILNHLAGDKLPAGTPEDI